jgi:hypothetical protein
MHLRGSADHASQGLTGLRNGQSKECDAPGATCRMPCAARAVFGLEPRHAESHMELAMASIFTLPLAWGRCATSLLRNPLVLHSKHTFHDWIRSRAGNIAPIIDDSPAIRRERTHAPRGLATEGRESPRGVSQRPCGHFGGTISRATAFGRSKLPMRRTCPSVA